MPEGLNVRLRDVLKTLAEQMASELDADACAISRVLGDVLILVAECVHDGSTLQLGQGYLVPDFPTTAAVLATGEPCAFTVDDPGVDPAEAMILRDLGYASLVMAPLLMSGGTWGLVEVYRRDVRPFTDDDVRRALELSRVD
jgi:GAF domain-containing protein